MKGNFVAKNMHKMCKSTVEENKKLKASNKPSKEDLDEIKQKDKNQWKSFH